MVIYKLVKGLPKDAATGCTLNVTLPNNRTAEPLMDGDTLCLRIRPDGLMLIVK